MAGNDSISSLNLKTNEYKMKIKTAKTDSTAVKKAKPKVVPVGQTEETNETQKAKQSSAPQKPQSQAKVQANKSQPAPEPKPKENKPTTITTNVTTKGMGAGAEDKTIGTFNTNIPAFKELNINNKPATVTVGGVGIYIADTSEFKGAKPIVKHEEGPPAYDIVSFGKSPVVKIPEQAQPAKGSIVFNPETNTYAFNGITDIEIDAEPKRETSKPVRENGQVVGYKAGGEKILINGGTVKSINVGEVTNHIGINSYTKVDIQPATVVLQDTKIENGKIILAGNDKVIGLGTTELTDENFVVNKDIGMLPSRVTTSNENTKLTDRAGLQAGYGIENAVDRWLNDGESAKLAYETTTTRGTVQIDSEIFEGVNMKDVPVSRTVGNLNIYEKSESGLRALIKEIPAKDGESAKIEIILPSSISATVFRIDANQPENARIFYSGKDVVMENLVGVELVGNTLRDRCGNNVSINLYLSNCDVEYIDTQETRIATYSTTEFIYDRKNAPSNIVLNNGTTVKKANGSWDNYYIVDEESKIESLETLGSKITTSQKENVKVKQLSLPAGDCPMNKTQILSPEEPKS